jgi:hypothetical protein
MDAIAKLSKESTESGKMIDTGGLQPSARGARLRLSGGKVTVTDGPFTESKELVGGYAIFQVESKAQMIELTRAFLQVHADVLGPSYETECEIREIFQNQKGETN